MSPSRSPESLTRRAKSYHQGLHALGSGMSASASIQDIQRTFRTYVKILMSRLMINSNAHSVAIAYVEMGPKEEAVAAIAALDGKELLGQRVRVGPSIAPFAKWAISDLSSGFADRRLAQNMMSNSHVLEIG